MRGKLGLLVCIGIVLAAGGGFYGMQMIKQSRTQTFQATGPIVQVPAAILFLPPSDDSSPTEPRKVSSDQIVRVQQALLSRPHDPRVLNDAGSVFAAAGQTQAANQFFEEALQHAPDDAVIHYNYARSLYQDGKVMEAVDQTNTALQLKPQFDEAHLLRSAAAVQQHDYGTAEDEIRKLANRLQAIALVTDGVIKLSQGKVQEGLNEFQQALRLLPDDATALYDSGVASQMLGSLPAAESLYRRAIASDPDLAEAHNNLGILLARAGNSQAAFEEFHQASIINPDNGTFAEHLSRSSQDPNERPDKLAGDWIGEGGSYEISGSINGQPGFESVPMPPGSRIKLRRVGVDTYEWDENAEAINVKTIVHRQNNGSFQAPAVTTIPGMPQLPPDVKSSGTITFWARGNTLFGDTVANTTGKQVVLKEKKSWKARRELQGVKDGR